MPRTDARTELGELFLAWHKRFRWFQDPTEEMNWSFEDPNFLEVFSKIHLIPGWHCLMFLIKDFEKNIGFSKISINSLSISHHFVYLLFVASFQKFANLPKKKSSFSTSRLGTPWRSIGLRWNESKIPHRRSSVASVFGLERSSSNVF